MSAINNPPFNVNAVQRMLRGVSGTGSTGTTTNHTIPTGELWAIDWGGNNAPLDGPRMSLGYCLIQSDPASFGEVIVDFDNAETPTLKTSGIKLLPGGAMEFPVVGQIVFHNQSGGDVEVHVMRVAVYESHYEGR